MYLSSPRISHQPFFFFSKRSDRAQTSPPSLRPRDGAVHQHIAMSASTPSLPSLPQSPSSDSTNSSPSSSMSRSAVAHGDIDSLILPPPLASPRRRSLVSSLINSLNDKHSAAVNGVCTENCCQYDSDSDDDGDGDSFREDDWVRVKRSSPYKPLTSPLATLCYNDLTELISLMRRGGTHAALVTGRVKPLMTAPMKAAVTTPTTLEQTSPSRLPPLHLGTTPPSTLSPVFATQPSPSSRVLFVFTGESFVMWILNNVKSSLSMHSLSQATKFAQAMLSYGHISLYRDNSTNNMASNTQRSLNAYSFSKSEAFSGDETLYYFTIPPRVLLNAVATMPNVHSQTGLPAMLSDPVTPTGRSPHSPYLSPSLSPHGGLPGRSTSSPAAAALAPHRSASSPALSDSIDSHRLHFPPSMQSLSSIERALYIAQTALISITDLHAAVYPDAPTCIPSRFPLQYQEFLFLVQLLAYVDLTGVTSAQHATFWLNMYNVVHLHTHAIHPNFITYYSSQRTSPLSHTAHLRILHSSQYIIQQATFSLLDIHYAILRSNLPATLTPPANATYPAVPFPPAFLASDSRRVHRRPVSKSTDIDCLFSFALTTCWSDSPNITVINSATVESQLRLCTQSYLRAHMDTRVVMSHSPVNTGHSQSPSLNSIAHNTVTSLEIIVPPLFALIRSDFGCNGNGASFIDWLTAIHWSDIEKSRFSDFAAANHITIDIQKQHRRMTNGLRKTNHLDGINYDDDDYECSPMA